MACLCFPEARRRICVTNASDNDIQYYVHNDDGKLMGEGFLTPKQRSCVSMLSIESEHDHHLTVFSGQRNGHFIQHHKRFIPAMRGKSCITITRTDVQGQHIPQKRAPDNSHVLF
eukprot:m.46268 g.46268  ORF g.46268 m.46268 type:complete len:115 (-) comp5919_c0_seq1:326-670(-)